VEPFVATAEDAGKRLDVWLHERLPRWSRARLQALIDEGRVESPARALTRHTRVRPGLACRVTVPPPEEPRLAPEPIPLDVLYEDGDIIVVNKAAGIVVHPAAGHASGTLVNALLYHCRDLAGIGGERRPGIVHRLDKDTSGVMVAAKNEAALHALVGEFKAGRVGKLYLALVAGVPEPAASTIETPIGRARHDRKKMSVNPPRGRRAVSHYRVLRAFPDAALLEVRIETGRTHQIRVHLAHLRHPVLGDRQYGSRRLERDAGLAAPRQMLHAARLTIRHPRDGAPRTFEAPLPDDMQTLLDRLSGLPS